MKEERLPRTVVGHEKAVREGLRKEQERENIQRVTVLMDPHAIARLWAHTVAEKGAGHIESLALSEALDWRHTEPQRLRDEAMALLALLSLPKKV